jgi:transposase
MESRIEMSQRERDLLKVMSTVLRGERTQSEAARLLGLTPRQVRRIQRRLEAEGDAGVVHRLRGRPSNRQADGSLREQAVAVYREQLADFGPTLASETLAERGVIVSPDSLRRWLTAAGLWTRKRHRDAHRSRRPRRECLGELVQMDTSIHDWLEGRGESMVLVAMIDDATGRVVARFYPGETVEAHFELLGRWLAKHGRPVALYTDHDSIFETQEKGQKVRGTTQFGRALGELGIELI